MANDNDSALDRIRDAAKSHASPSSDHIQSERLRQIMAVSGSEATTHNLIKDPDDWKTGHAPATDAQLSYLHTLVEGTDRRDDIIAQFDTMTKAEASDLIEEMQGSKDS